MFPSRPAVLGAIGAGLLALTTVACAPAPADWTPAQSGKDGAVARTEERLVLETPGGGVGASALARLERLLDRKGVDTVWISLRPRSADGRAAVETAVEALVSRGVAANRIEVGPTAAGQTGDLEVVAERWVALAPDCPDWSRANVLGDNNLESSNFGCATRRNLMRQVADPRDLVRGRRLAPVPPGTAAGAVERYRAREVEPLRETSVSGVE